MRSFISAALMSLILGGCAEVLNSSPPSLGATFLAAVHQDSFESPATRPVRRWITPIVIGLRGEEGDTWRNLITQWAGELARATGHPIRLAQDEPPNLIVGFAHGSATEYDPFYRGMWGSLFLVLDFIRAAREFDRTKDSCLTSHSWLAERSEITRALVLTPRDAPLANQRLCIFTSLFRLTGALGAEPIADRLTIESGDGLPSLTDSGSRLLGALYDRRIAAGDRIEATIMRLDALGLGLDLGKQRSTTRFSVAENELIVSGRIAPRADLDLLAYLVAHRAEVKRVHFFESPGGDFTASLQMGRHISSRRLPTIASGQCIGGCALAFLGGTERSLAPDPGGPISALGFHGGVLTDTARQALPTEERNRAITAWDAKITAYFRQMLSRRIETATIQRILSLRGPGQYLWFVNPNSPGATRLGTPLVYECRKPDPFQRDLKQFLSRCEALPGLDALKQGIITSATPLKSSSRVTSDSNAIAELFTGATRR